MDMYQKYWIHFLSVMATRHFPHVPVSRVGGGECIGSAKACCKGVKDFTGCGKTKIVLKVMYYSLVIEGCVAGSERELLPSSPSSPSTPRPLRRRVAREETEANHTLDSSNSQRSTASGRSTRNITVFRTGGDTLEAAADLFDDVVNPTTKKDLDKTIAQGKYEYQLFVSLEQSKGRNSGLTYDRRARARLGSSRETS
jgi:hypothetical protein